MPPLTKENWSDLSAFIDEILVSDITMCYNKTLLLYCNNNILIDQEEREVWHEWPKLKYRSVVT
jgi:hypothetical protein